MAGTLVRTDSITLHNQKNHEIYQLLLKWLKKKGFKIIYSSEPFQIYGEQRISGESMDIDHWHKNIDVDISDSVDGYKLTIKLFSPYIMDKKQKKEAQLLWGEYIESIYRFIGVRITNIVLNDIHSSDYYDYKEGEFLKSKIIIIIIFLVINIGTIERYFLTEINYYIMGSLILVDFIIIYLLLKKYRVDRDSWY